MPDILLDIIDLERDVFKWTAASKESQNSVHFNFSPLKDEISSFGTLLNYLLKSFNANCKENFAVPFVTAVVVVAFVVAQSSLAASVLSSESFD